ncbi:Zinc finger protein 2, partial [Frankliniella fusca]
VLCRALPCSTVLCRALPCSTVLCRVCALKLFDRTSSTDHHAYTKVALLVVCERQLFDRTSSTDLHQDHRASSVYVLRLFDSSSSTGHHAFTKVTVLVVACACAMFWTEPQALTFTKVTDAREECPCSVERHAACWDCLSSSPR